MMILWAVDGNNKCVGWCMRSENQWKCALCAQSRHVVGTSKHCFLPWTAISAAFPKFLLERWSARNRAESALAGFCEFEVCLFFFFYYIFWELQIILKQKQSWSLMLPSSCGAWIMRWLGVVNARWTILISYYLMQHCPSRAIKVASVWFSKSSEYLTIMGWSIVWAIWTRLCFELFPWSAHLDRKSIANISALSF